MYIINVKSDEANGTSLAGYLTCSFDELHEAFGSPDFEPTFDKKVTCEWTLRFVTDDGRTMVFTVYNWKDPRPPEENEDWHIGSNHEDDQAILDFLNKNLANTEARRRHKNDTF